MPSNNLEAGNEGGSGVKKTKTQPTASFPSSRDPRSFLSKGQEWGAQYEHPKRKIKFAAEGGAAGITAVGVGEHQHVLQELEQRLDLLAFLDIVQPDDQLLQSLLLLLFLIAALTGATGHGAAETAESREGRLLLSELLRRLRCRPSPRPPPRPRQRQPRPSLSLACPVASRRWELRRGKAKAATPRSKNSNGALGKEDTAQLAPFGKTVSFKSSPYWERSNFFPQRMQCLTIQIGQLHRRVGDCCGFCGERKESCLLASYLAPWLPKGLSIVWSL